MLKRMIAVLMAALGFFLLVSLTWRYGSSAQSARPQGQSEPPRLADLYVISGTDENVIHLDGTPGAHLMPNGGFLGIVEGTVGDLSAPVGLAIRPGTNTLFVSEVGNGADVRHYDLTSGAALGSFGETLENIGLPRGLTFDPLGYRLYVLDILDPASVKAFDAASGAFLGIWGDTDEHLDNPIKIEIQPGTENIFVLDCPGNDCNLLVFAPDGTFIGPFPTGVDPSTKGLLGTGLTFAGATDFSLDDGPGLTPPGSQPTQGSAFVTSFSRDAIIHVSTEDGAEISRVLGLLDPTAIASAPDPTGESDSIITLVAIRRTGSNGSEIIQVFRVDGINFVNLGSYNPSQLGGKRIGDIVLTQKAPVSVVLAATPVSNDTDPPPHRG